MGKGYTADHEPCDDCGRWVSPRILDNKGRCPACSLKRTPAAQQRSQRQAKLRRYGLTGRDHAALVQAQDGRCAICSSRPRAGLVIDHDHDTGKVRGLLCNNCNLGLGLMGDDSERLARAATYLASPPAAKLTAEKSRRPPTRR